MLKRSSIILVTAAVLLGLMYWQKPRPPSQTENPTPTKTLSTQTNKTLALGEPRVATARKPKIRQAVGSNGAHQATLKNPVRPLPEVLQALPAYLKPLVE